MMADLLGLVALAGMATACVAGILWAMRHYPPAEPCPQMPPPGPDLWRFQIRAGSDLDPDGELISEAYEAIRAYRRGELIERGARRETV
jgi:hypothetical protein